jgi:hypothetical protein
VKEWSNEPQFFPFWHYRSLAGSGARFNPKTLGPESRRLVAKARFVHNSGSVARPITQAFIEFDHETVARKLLLRTRIGVSSRGAVSTGSQSSSLKSAGLAD